MSIDNSLNFKPLCVNIIQKDNAENKDKYYPFDKKGVLLQTPIAKYIADRGYLFDSDSELWYILNTDGLYYETNENLIKTEIFTLLHKISFDVNYTTNFINSVVNEAKHTSNTINLYDKFDEFLYTDSGMSYDIPIGYDGNLIQLKNGILNTATMELLANCGYLFNPCPLNVEYSPIPEEDLFSGVYYDTYLNIIPDEQTLKFYLYWVGTVIFSDKPEQMILFLYGKGGTGKSSMAEALAYLLGSKRVSHAGIDILSNPHGTAILENKKLNVADETEKGNYSGIEGILKNLTGDTITINGKYKAAKDIKNTVNLLFLGNSFIECDMSDAGLMRRIKVIECPNIQKYDENIPKLLKDNEFINWLFNAAYYQWNKYKHTDIEKLVSLPMRDQLNNVLSLNGFNGWLFDYCGSLDLDLVQNKLKGVPYSELYISYSDYVKDILGCDPLIKKKFGEKLRINYGLKYGSFAGKNIMYIVK